MQSPKALSGSGSDAQSLSHVHTPLESLCVRTLHLPGNLNERVISKS